MQAKFECFSVEDNGLIEVLHCPELLVPSGETICKVVQRLWPMMAKDKCFSAKANGLVGVLHYPSRLYRVARRFERLTRDID